jgi:hypothetical protein
MQRAVLGVEHRRAFVDLQRDAERAPGEQLGEVRAHDCHHRLARGVDERALAAAPDPRVDVDERAVGRTVGDRELRRRIREHPRAADRKDARPRAVALRDEDLGERLAEHADVGIGLEVRGVLDDDVRHCILTGSTSSPPCSRPKRSGSAHSGAARRGRAQRQRR